MTKQIKNHPNFTASDYSYLSAKGYTDREILALWNRKSERGVTHKQIPNFVQYFTVDRGDGRKVRVSVPV